MHLLESELSGWCNRHRTLDGKNAVSLNGRYGCPGLSWDICGLGDVMADRVRANRFEFSVIDLVPGYQEIESRVQPLKIGILSHD